MMFSSLIRRKVWSAGTTFQDFAATRRRTGRRYTSLSSSSSSFFLRERTAANLRPVVLAISQQQQQQQRKWRSYVVSSSSSLSSLQVPPPGVQQQHERGQFRATSASLRLLPPLREKELVVLDNNSLEKDGRSKVSSSPSIQVQPRVRQRGQFRATSASLPLPLREEEEEEEELVLGSQEKDGCVYFKLNKLLPREEYLELARALRTTTEFSTEKKQYFIPTEILDRNPLFGEELRDHLASLNVRVLPLPNEKKFHPLLTALIKTQRRKSNTVVIFYEKQAYWIVPPKDGPGETIRTIIREDLSGVTEEIRWKMVECLFLKACFRTYDVWLVDEFLERVQNMGLVDKKEQEGEDSTLQQRVDLFLGDSAKENWENRFRDKDERRRPIAAVEQLRNPNFALYPHQMEGVRFFMENNGCGLLGDEVGLGKTVTALAYIASQGKRALVVTPKKVVQHWCESARTHFSRYFGEDPSCLVLTEFKKWDKRSLRRKLSQAPLVCVNYEALDRFHDVIKKAAFDTIVIDESQYIKNKYAKRTKLLLKIKDSFPHRILLSGTPIKNSIDEIVPQLKFLGLPEERTKDIHKMTPGAFWNFLHEEKYYLRREILKELPHLQFLSAERIMAAGMAGISFDVFDEKDELLLKETVETSLDYASQDKIEFTSDLAANLFRKNCSDKIVIMTERINTAKTICCILQKSGISAVLHHGELSQAMRSCVLKSFCHDDNGNGPRVLVSTRHSINVGLNLQCANHVIFNDLPYSPADILQAAGRVKRLNQQKTVHEYWMLTELSFDLNLVEILERKILLIRQMAEGKNVSDFDQRWMHKKVSYHELYYGPDYKPTTPETEPTTQEAPVDERVEEGPG